MQTTTTRRQIQSVFNIHNIKLEDEDRSRIDEDLERLSRHVVQFPVADLHVLIEGNPRTSDVAVKLSLILPGTALVASDHHQVLSAAFSRCVASLATAIEGYKARLNHEAARQKVKKGTLHPMELTRNIDTASIEKAVDAGDYGAFREAAQAFERAIQKRACRWIQRFPEYEARVGNGLTVSDATEEVLLMAFDQYADRPTAVPFGEWLLRLIDPAIKALIRQTSEEVENLNLTRSAMEFRNETESVPAKGAGRNGNRPRRRPPGRRVSKVATQGA